jgi:hypothetical protein
VSCGPPPAGRGECLHQNAGSPGAVRLRQTGDIFRRLVSENPAGEATPGREQSAGYARRRHLMRDCGRGFDSHRLHCGAKPRNGPKLARCGAFCVRGTANVAFVAGDSAPCGLCETQSRRRTLRSQTQPGRSRKPLSGLAVPSGRIPPPPLTCPSATAPWSRPDCAARGPATTTRSRSTAYAPWPTSSTVLTPAPPRHSGKASRRPSPSPAWGSAGRSSGRFRARTRASRWCATRRRVKGEIGRTTLNRAGCDAGPGPMQRFGEAGGSRGAGSRVDGGSSPDDVAAGRHCQTLECAQARPKGRAKAKRWLKPLDRISSPEPGG